MYLLDQYLANTSPYSAGVSSCFRSNTKLVLQLYSSVCQSVHMFIYHFTGLEQCCVNQCNFSCITSWGLHYSALRETRFICLFFLGVMSCTRHFTLFAWLCICVKWTVHTDVLFCSLIFIFHVHRQTVNNVVTICCEVKLYLTSSLSVLFDYLMKHTRRSALWIN